MHINNSTQIRRVYRMLSAVQNVIPFLFWVAIVFAFEISYIAFMTLICAVIHELGHIFAAYRICGGSMLKSRFFGMRLFTKNGMSYKNEIIVAAAGPAANAIAAISMLPLMKVGGAYLADFFILNICTAVSNLLPIDGYDGYRIAESTLLLIRKKSYDTRLLGYISLSLTVAVCFITLYLMVNTDSGYWIYLVFIVSMLNGIKKSSDSFLRENKRKTEISRGNKSFAKEIHRFP